MVDLAKCTAYFPVQIRFKPLEHVPIDKPEGYR
jgi:hypothetical protein